MNVFEKVLLARVIRQRSRAVFTPVAAARRRLESQSRFMPEADGQAEAQRLVELVTAAREDSCRLSRHCAVATNLPISFLH